MPGDWYHRQEGEEQCQPRATEMSQEGQTVCQATVLVGKRVKSSVSQGPQICHKKVRWLVL